ncbi:VanZ family protein [Glutamicibacter halophytocola]|uniref:VanZ family protein n=1 Tax=Glutamicibacter halophytocola TaxID=1933880 RepID=UPI0018928A50|nr:VanZ family protein [Glutamicibacter halophytocola]
MPSLYLLAMIGIAFWPVPVDSSAGPALAWTLNWLHARGVPAFVDYGFVEFSANILFFIPLGIFLGMGLRRFWIAEIVGIVASSLLELGQLLFLPNRFATLSDVVANSLGAALGTAIWLAASRTRLKQKARKTSDF